MHAIFEEAGKFNAGKILSETDSNAQIELESGKRVKVKLAQVLLRFEKPTPTELMALGKKTAQAMDVDLAYEFAPTEEFGFQELSKEYFSSQASLGEQLACLLLLFENPHYFKRSGKGRFKKASAEVVQLALAAIEKKKRIQEQTDAWSESLARGQCPGEVKEQLYKILFKPDKNAPEYKAVVQASKLAQKPPLHLLQDAGAITSAYEFHWQRFLFDQFPKGVQFPALAVAPFNKPLPKSLVKAFSIDDSQTTEIDDALSLSGLQSGEVTLGIHIAAPALCFQPGDPLDTLAKARLSTVYMPGHKITMLPSEVVDVFTLQEGKYSPALSLYITLDEDTLEIKHSNTLLEEVFIQANLRHDVLEPWINNAWLEATERSKTLDSPPSDLLNIEDAQQQLAFLFRLAKQLKAKREEVRGKPETFNRPDYQFRLESMHQGATEDVPDKNALTTNPKAQKGPSGDERVIITERQRGSALDLIVAEAMILANSRWGQWMAEMGVPAIYRSQASMLPGVKVRMGTKALPHAGIGVPCYAWSTSPLRRYTDMVNQWQLIACVTHGNTAALAAPFKPKDVELFAIISSFEAAYSAYNGYQGSMERFWTLQYLAQENLDELTVTVIKNMPGQPVMVRAVNLPLVMPVIGNNALLRGETIRVKLQGIDLISLDVHAQFLESLEKPLGFNASAQSDGSSSLTGAEDLADLLAQDENDDTLSLGPLNISVDMDSEEDGEKNGNEKSGSEKTASIDAAATDGAASDTAATDVLAS
jgi:exoribonuclease-2